MQTALRFYRFQTVRRALSIVWRPRSVARPARSSDVLWAVGAAKRRSLVRSTCLGEALLGEALLRRHGYAPKLCIGAAVREGRFEAHAWLEQDSAIVMGGPEEVVRQYTRFPEIASLTL